MRNLICINVIIQLEEKQVIKMDKGLNRQVIQLAKLSKYQLLHNPAVPILDFLMIVGDNKSNDTIDKQRLYLPYN